MNHHPIRKKKTESLVKYPPKCLFLGVEEETAIQRRVRMRWSMSNMRVATPQRNRMRMASEMEGDRLHHKPYPMIRVPFWIKFRTYCTYIHLISLNFHCNAAISSVYKHLFPINLALLIVTLCATNKKVGNEASHPIINRCPPLPRELRSRSPCKNCSNFRPHDFTNSCLYNNVFLTARCRSISRVSSRTLTYGAPPTVLQATPTGVRKPAQSRKIHVYGFYNEDGSVMQSEAYWYIIL